MPDHLLQKEVLQLPRELIAIPSTHSRPREIDNCAQFIENWLKVNNIDYERQDSDNIPCLKILPQKNAAQILLMSHFDVVEVDNDAQFTTEIEGDRLYGRGSIDDKYGIALSLILFREHKKQVEQNGGSAADVVFGLLFTGDEEIGGENGAAIASKQIATDFFIAVDGGRPDLIVTKEKGILQLLLTATGKAAHAARPWLGVSGFDILVEDYLKVQELFAKKTDDHWHKTMVLTQCKAGNGSSNIIPEKATATLDIRYTENDDPEILVESIQKMVQSEVIVNAMEPIFSSGPSAYLDMLVEHSGGAAVGFEHGASDARYLSQLGIPGAIWGADGEMSQHTQDEHIVISSLFSLYDRLDSFLKTIAKGS